MKGGMLLRMSRFSSGGVINNRRVSAYNKYDNTMTMDFGFFENN